MGFATTEWTFEPKTKTDSGWAYNQAEFCYNQDVSVENEADVYYNDLDLDATSWTFASD